MIEREELMKKLLDNANILEIMNKIDIPAAAIAQIDADGTIAETVIGTTSCGLYFLKGELPTIEKYSRFDSSRYLLTNDGLYFYDLAQNTVKTITQDKLVLSNIEQYVADDITYGKYKEIPALNNEQLAFIQSQTKHAFKPEPIDANTKFGAASLSKPLFFYLVLSLIEEEPSKKHKLGLSNFGLDTPLYELLPGFEEGGALAKTITVGHVLSHQTGISNCSQGSGRPEVLFKPGEAFDYAGFPVLYLQRALEHTTGHSLQELAQEYVFSPCDMKNSDFLIKGAYFNVDVLSERTQINRVKIMAWTREGLLKTFKIKGEDDDYYSPEMIKRVILIDELKKNNWTQPQIERKLNEPAPLFPIDTSQLASISANSLRTTAADYAKFMQTWMNDKKCSKYLSMPIVSLTKDAWAKSVGIPDAVLERLYWGYGMGMQLDVQGNVRAVFHNGDMNQWRAIVTMNPQTKTGTVFFTNSHNGDVLTEVLTKEIDAKLAVEFIRDKFGFTVAYEDDWASKETARGEVIGAYLKGVVIDAAEKNLEFASQQLKEAEARLNELKQPEGRPAENLKAWKAYQQLVLELSGSVRSAEAVKSEAESRLKIMKISPSPIYQEKTLNAIESMIDSAKQSEDIKIKTSDLSSDNEWSEEEASFNKNKETCRNLRNAVQDLKSENTGLTVSDKQTYLTPTPADRLKSPKPQ